MMRDSHGPENPDTSRGYEVEDASVREVLWTGVGLAVGTIIVCIAVFGLLRVLQNAEIGSRQPISELNVSTTVPPEPRLQEKPWVEMELFRQREDQMLTTYGWADQASGRVRIPIDRAMDMVIQRGLPARKGGAAGATPTSAPDSTTSGAQREAVNAPVQR
jgi:hypothetical protein